MPVPMYVPIRVPRNPLILNNCSDVPFVPMLGGGWSSHLSIIWEVGCSGSPPVFRWREVLFLSLRLFLKQRTPNIGTWDVVA